MSPELVERRILGGIVLVDVSTQMPVRRPMLVRVDPDQEPEDRPPATDVHLLANRSSRYAILGATGLEEHVLSEEVGPDDRGIYEPRPGPAERGGPRDYSMRVDDPLRRYLPRRFVMRLPRDPALEHADRETSLFRPDVVEMLPAPAAVGSPGWSVLRVRVRHASHPELGLPFAVVCVERDGRVDAIGMTDARGEGTVFVTDLPAREWGRTSADPLSTPEIECRIEAAFDPRRNPLGPDLAAALRSVAERAAMPDPERALRAVDPRELEVRRPLLPRASTSMKLSAGRTRHVELALPLDPL